jgi:hypothetical protein
LVVEADDIVFSEIRAALDLDELERHLAGIGEAMTGTGGDVGRLILLEDRVLSPTAPG